MRSKNGLMASVLFATIVTVTGSVAAQCVGDCDQDGRVTVDEVLKGVNVALGNASLDQCPSFDFDGNKRVTVDELIKAVNNAMDGCFYYCFLRGLVSSDTGLVASREAECFTTVYKNSLAAMAFIHEGDMKAAEGIFDFFQTRPSIPFDGFPQTWDPCTGTPTPSENKTCDGTVVPHNWEGDNAFLLLALNYYAQKTGSYGMYHDIATALANYLTERANSSDKIIPDGVADMYAALQPLGNNWDNWKTLSKLYNRFYLDPTCRVNYAGVADHTVRGALVFGDTAGLNYLSNFSRKEIWQSDSNIQVNAFAAYLLEDFINLEISAQLLLTWRLWQQSVSTNLSSLRSELEKLKIPSQQNPVCAGLPYYVRHHDRVGFDGDYKRPIIDSTAYLLYDQWQFNPFAPDKMNAGCRYDRFVRLETENQEQGFPRLFVVGQDWKSFPQEI